MRRNEPDMPRCISSTSPDPRSANRYLARRPISTSGNSGMADRSCGLSRNGFGSALAEHDVIEEGIGHGHGGRAPRLVHQTGAGKAVLLGQQGGLISSQADGFDNNLGTGRTIAVMFAQMQNDVAQRHLHEKRQIRLETVLEIDLEAEKSDEKFLALGLAKVSRDRKGSRKSCCHDMTLQLTKAPVARRR